MTRIVITTGIMIATETMITMVGTCLQGSTAIFSFKASGMESRVLARMSKIVAVLTPTIGMSSVIRMCPETFGMITVTHSDEVTISGCSTCSVAAVHGPTKFL